MITIATYRCCWTSHDDVTIEPLDFLNSECAYYLCTLRLLNHSLSTHLPIDSLTHLPTHSLTHSLSHPLTHSAHSMDSWLVYPQVSLSVLPNLRRENTALVALTKMRVPHLWCFCYWLLSLTTPSLLSPGWAGSQILLHSIVSVLAENRVEWVSGWESECVSEWVGKWVSESIGKWVDKEWLSRRNVHK